MISTKAKRFKDPIYGYIEIEDNLIAEVVDTATFQRLRDVVQTSYAPLYSSAVHNRFVHSLGVYYLGRMVADAFLISYKKVSNEKIPDIEDYLSIFRLACLLHDVGHAPFSHTGEQFYLQDKDHGSLHTLILNLISDDVLCEEIKKESYKAAAHELMSVIVSLKAFSDLIPELKDPCRFNAVSNVLKAGESKRKKFFFLFYNRKEDQQEIKITELITEMIALANEKMNREKIQAKTKSLNLRLQ